MIKNEKFYIGIDLGGKDKETTGLCILAEKGNVECEMVKGKDVLKKGALF
ncbi:hypothetical protein KJ636_00785 [Patescibacteria group bacterium]|nr:hypothetical protein [Patescibacteria group bacterium]MBU4481798.1 hypothetical protein [Patescibacteria group bacterium]